MKEAAIWGVGFIAEVHAEALKKLGIPIRTVVSRSYEKAQRFAEKWGIANASDDPAALLDGEIACVHVCTPPTLHTQQVRFMLENGENVLCEKPLCTDARQAQALADLARERGLVCAVNFNNRFHPACIRAREVIASPQFGRVLLVHGSYLQQFGCAPAQMGWRYDPKLAGPMHAVTEIGSHWLDLAETFCGRRIEAVSAQFDRFFPERWVRDGKLYTQAVDGGTPVTVDSEDAAILSLRFSDGAIGSVVLSEVTPGKYNELIVEVTGEKQSLRWNAEEASILHRADCTGAMPEQFAQEDGFADSFAALAQAVYRDIGAGAPSQTPDYPDFSAGAHSAAVCEAVWESAQRDAAWVRISEVETQ